MNCYGNSIILASIEEGRGIKIIDVETGQEKAVIQDDDIDISKICIIEQSIFTALSTNVGDIIGIGEWTTRGEKKQTFLFQENMSRLFSCFRGSPDFFIDCPYDDIFIHKLKENKSISLSISGAVGVPCIIGDACISGEHLICALKPCRGLHLCVINLETGEITYKKRFEQIETADKIGAVAKRILPYKQGVYIGYLSGDLVASDLHSNNYRIFGQHSSKINSLAIEEPLLISGSCGDETHQAEVKFWHLPSLTQISCLQYPSCFEDSSGLEKIKFVSGKVLATDKGSLIQWDYLVAHQGEKITKESETEIKVCYKKDSSNDSSDDSSDDL